MSQKSEQQSVDTKQVEASNIVQNENQIQNEPLFNNQPNKNKNKLMEKGNAPQQEGKEEANSPFTRCSEPQSVQKSEKKAIVGNDNDNDIDMKMNVPPEIIQTENVSKVSVESPFVRRAETEEIESDEATLSPDLSRVPQQNAPQIITNSASFPIPSMSGKHYEIDKVSTLKDLIKDRENENKSPFVRDEQMDIDEVCIWIYAV